MEDALQAHVPGELGPDDTLMPISRIQWVAANAFCVAIPQIRAKLLFELTAVGIPRTQRKDVLDSIKKLVASINKAPRAFIRLDHVQSYPTEVFADVVYLAKTTDDDTVLSWRSLQEGVLRCGAGILIRPSAIRHHTLVEAERYGVKVNATHCTWLQQAVARESSPTFTSTGHRCRVIDVVRGDVFVVEWLPMTRGAHDTPLPLHDTHSTSRGLRLLILDAVVCLPPSTLTGRRALQWSQQHVLHTTLQVTVHSREPLDKDVSLSTQLDSFEQLASIRGTASVQASGEDVAETLVRLGLAKLRCGIDASAPRPSNFFPLIHAIHEEFARQEPFLCEPWSNDVLGVLQRMWKLPRRHLWSLLASHGERWSAGIVQHCVAALNATREGTSDAAASQQVALPPLGLTARLWSRYVWCGSVLTGTPEVSENVFFERPLRSLCSLQMLLSAATPPSRGLVTNVSVVSACDVTTTVDAPTEGLLLQVEVNLLAPVSQWVATCGAGMGSRSADLFRLDPPPRPVPYSVRRPLEVFIECDTRLLPWRVGAYLSIEVKAIRPTPCSKSEDSHGEAEPNQVGSAGEEADGDEELVETVRIALPEHHTRVTLPVPASTLAVQAYEISVRCLPAEEGSDPLAAFTAQYWLRTAPSAEQEDEPVLIEDAAEALLELREEGGARDAADGEMDMQDSDPSTSLSDEDGALDADGDGAATSTAEGDPGVPTPPARVGGHDEPTPDIEPHYFAKVLMFLAIPSAVRVEDLSPNGAFSMTATSAHTDAITHLAHQLLHRDVLALFAGRATVNDVRGLMGDILFFSPDASPTLSSWRPPNLVDDVLSGSLTAHHEERFPHSLLETLDQLEAKVPAITSRPLSSWPSTAQIRAVACRQKLSPQRLSSVDDTTGTLGHVVVGRTQPWMEHGTDMRALPVLCRDTFTPYVSLAQFAIRPRQLFCGTSNDQHKILEKEQRTGEDDSVQNIDWAIMRLSFRRLPNVMRCNLELLPLSLRNVERAYCRHLMRTLHATHSLRVPARMTEGDSIRALEDAVAVAGASAKPLPPLHGDETSTARVLALLLLLMRGAEADAPEDDTADATAAAYHVLSEQCKSISPELKPSLITEVVLYRLPQPTAQAAATTTDTDCVWFLGSRDVPSSDLFEDSAESGNIAPETVPHPLRRGDLRRVVAALGRDALIDAAPAAESSPLVQMKLSSEQVSDDVCPLTHKGLGPFPSRADTRRLYHPAEGVHIIGAPLVVHEEVAADDLADLMAHRDKSSEADVSLRHRKRIVQRLIDVEYVPVYLARNSHPYKLFSYGRIGRTAIGELQRLRAAFGSAAITYLTLLLRQNAQPEASVETRIADGQLLVYGVASEALYAHYRSRRDLRFTLGASLPVLRKITYQSPPGGVGTTTSLNPGDERAERQLVRDLCAQLRLILKQITQKLVEQNVLVERVLLQWVAHLQGDRPYMAVHVYPVDDHETIPRAGGGICDNEQDPIASFEGNPHRPFTTGYGVVRQRLPLGELRITRADHTDAYTVDFSCKWLAQLEPVEESHH